MIDAEARVRHMEFLHERIYQTNSKWPHFSGMLTVLEDLADHLPNQSVVVDLERAYVYGGTCLFAPLFSRQKVIAIDCQLPSTRERFGYQADWVNDRRCIRWPPDHAGPITALNLPADTADAVIVPNIVHHVRDQDLMFKEFARILKPGGKGFIFEALVRELHQVPDDYVRYTPFGFEYNLGKHGLSMTRWQPTTGVFDVIAYAWTQALEFLDDPDRRELTAWFYEHEFPRLQSLDRKYKQNLVHPTKSFPMAFIVEFMRPVRS